MGDLATSAGRPVLGVPESINTPEAIAEVAGFRPDLLVVCDYGQVLSPVMRCGWRRWVASICMHRCCRSFAVRRSIGPSIAREKETGASVIHMSPLLDGNIPSPIAARRSATATTPSNSRLAWRKWGSRRCWRRSKCSRTGIGRHRWGGPKTQAQVTQARRRKTDALVNWKRTAWQIQRQVRAFQPWPGTYTLWKRGTAEPLRLVLDGVTDALASEVVTATPGTVIKSDGQSLWIATGRALQIDRIQPAGKKVMAVAESLAGLSADSRNATGRGCL